MDPKFTKDNIELLTGTLRELMQRKKELTETIEKWKGENHPPGFLSRLRRQEENLETIIKLIREVEQKLNQYNK